MQTIPDTEIDDDDLPDEPVEPDQFSGLIRTGRARLTVVMIVLILLAIKPSAGIITQAGFVWFLEFVVGMVFVAWLVRFGWRGLLAGAVIAMMFVDSYSS